MIATENQALAAVTPAARLLGNPGFESGLSNWTTDNAGATAVVTSPVHGGSGAVRITDTSTTSGVSVRSAHLAVLPGEEITASIWAQQTAAGAGGSLYLEFWNAAGSRTTPVVAADAATSTAWQKLTAVGTVPEDAVTATVLAYTSWADNGVTYWDDAAVAALPPPLRKVPNASFEERRNTEVPTQWTSTGQSCAGPSCPVQLLRGTVAHGGTGYVLINDTSADEAISVLSDAVPVSVGETITASAFAHRLSGDGARIYLEFRDSAGTRIGVHDTVVPAGSGWQKVKVSGTAPSGTTTLTVRLYGDLAGVGQARWDDVELRSSADTADSATLAAGAPVLFVGDQRVESYTGVERVVHPGTKGANDGRVLTGTGAGTWDANPRMGGTVLPGIFPGEPAFTMWYQTSTGTGRAISNDGITWSRDGRTSTVYSGGPQGVVRNPAWVPGATVPKFFMMAAENMTYIGKQSNDGITWSAVPGARGIPGFDVATATYDPATRRFVAMIKNQLNAPYGPRTTWVSYSTDFKTWTTPSPSFAADLVDDARIPAGAGRLGTTAWSEVYGMPAIRYGDQYLGVPWIFDIVYSPNPFGNPGTDKGRSHLGVAASRDLVNWSRPDRGDLVAPGPAGSWDYGFNLSSNGFVTVTLPDGTSQTRLYYGAFSGEHLCDSAAINAGQCTTPYGPSNVGMVSWPTDRFASFHADGAGVVTTRPLTAAGNALTVNYKPAAAGDSLRAEVLDVNGNPIPGYAAADSIPVTTDALAPGVRVAWTGGNTLPAGAVRLRFHLDGGDLYSFAAN
ncbi:carbohydrate binding domain-containing protein [Catenuloplanes nepalensis]|uniref:carbohydrate binding domain-containing protein n=1 Tax=Catenuloplanes nepalensis TaxID=587533 RepID=UPI0027D7976F|nr:carbohydrate binding domain-containing protein [Catenuloplanes nepalensis]